MYFALRRRAAEPPGDTVPVLGSAGGVRTAGGIPTVKENRLLLRNAGVLGVGWREYLTANPGAAQEYADGVAQLVADRLRPPAPQSGR